MLFVRQSEGFEVTNCIAWGNRLQHFLKDYIIVCSSIELMCGWFLQQKSWVVSSLPCYYSHTAWLVVCIFHMGEIDWLMEVNVAVMPVSNTVFKNFWKWMRCTYSKHQVLLFPLSKLPRTRLLFTTLLYFEGDLGWMFSKVSFFASLLGLSWASPSLAVMSHVCVGLVYLHACLLLAWLLVSIYRKF